MAMDRYTKTPSDEELLEAGSGLAKAVTAPASAGPRGAVPGTVHTWSDGSQYKKQSSGKWEQVAGPKKPGAGKPSGKPKAGAKQPQVGGKKPAAPPVKAGGKKPAGGKPKPEGKQPAPAGEPQPQQIPQGADGLKSMMAAALQQYGAEAVAKAAQEAMGQVAQHVDKEMGDRAKKLATNPNVLRVVKAHVGEGADHKKFDEGKLQEVADALKSDEEVRHLATRELHQMAPGITAAAEDAAVKAGVKADPKIEPSKAKAVARAILTGGAGSFVFGFIDNFLMLAAGSGIDSVLTHMGLGAAWTAGIGNAISDSVGQAGGDKIEGVLDRLGLGEAKTSGALKEKTEARIKSVSSVAGVFVGALAGMIPLAFGVRFGKSFGMVWFDGEPEVGRMPRLLIKARTAPAPTAPELLIILVDMDLAKGAGHKYLLRKPTGKDKPKYRYIYRYPSKKKLTEEDHLVSGTKLKVEHQGKEGHFEVEHHDREKNVVRLKHDESGKIAHVHVSDLHRMVQAYHKKKGTAEHQKKAKKKTPAKAKREEPTPPPLKLRSPAQQKEMTERIKPAEKPDKGPAPELPAIKMEDVGRRWEGILGVYGSKEQADAAARDLGEDGYEYAAVAQPGSVVVSYRKKVERTGIQREATGESTVVKTRDSSGKGVSDMEAEYVLMEADDVIASHNPMTMAPREDYPEGVQERRYHELVGEEMKVDRIAKNLDPAIVANTNPDGVNGTPILTEDGVVLGGNGRSMAMQRAYASYPESAAKLKDYLEQQARTFGLSSAEVRGMKEPVLVRRVKAGDDPTHLRALGRRMNQSLTQGLDPRTEAVVMAQNYVDETLVSKLTDSIEPDQTLNDFLTSHHGRDFVVALTHAGIIDAMNRDEFVEVGDPERPKATDGLLNEDGRTMVERVLAARFVEDPKLLSSMRPSLRANIAKCAPYLLRAAAAGWDVREAMKIAVGADVGNRGRRDRPSVDKFLSSPELTIPGEEKEYGNLVRKDPLAGLLMRMIQEPGPKEKGHNGTKLMPRGMREFARRAEMAAHTREGSMFGETPETPEHALDMSFGLSGEGQEYKRQQAAEAAAKEQEAAEAMGFASVKEMKVAAKEQEGEIKRKKKRMGKKPEAEEQPMMFALSVGDLVKAVADKDLPAYLINAVVGELRHLLDAKLHVVALSGGKLHVSKAELQRKVLDMVTHAMVRDPDMARAVGAQPLEPGMVDGLIEAMVQQRQGKLAKACRHWWGRRMGALCKGSAKPAAKPPGAGWTQIPGGKRGGYRKMHTGGWMYWYPDQDTHQRESMITGKGVEDVPVAPAKLDKKRALHEAESMLHMDDVRRALVVAERVHRTHAAAAEHPIYGKMMRELPGKIAGIKGQIERSRDIGRVHQLQEKARDLAHATYKEARIYEEKQGSLFGGEDTSLPDRKELTHGEVERHAKRSAALYRRSKEQRDDHLSDIREKHGPAEAEKVYHRSLEHAAAQRKGVAPRLTVGTAPAKGVLHPGASKPEPAKPKPKPAKPKAQQGSLFGHNTLLGDAPGQRTLPGMGGGLFG